MKYSPYPLYEEGLYGGIWKKPHLTSPWAGSRFKTALRQELRQLFYQLAAVHRVVEKTEAQYHAIGRQLGEMRVNGSVPWEYVSDNTRWMRKPRTYGSMSAALRETALLYRRDLWRDSEAYVEVWIEKDALAGVLYGITENYDVPLMVSRGFASLSYIHESALAIRAQKKPAFIYYFGDHDPSGVQIDRSIEKRLREFAPDAEVYFERVAVLEEQIEDWNLPTRPTKQTDSRAKNFKGDSVELDAIPPARLRELAHDCIHRHLDQDAYEHVRKIESEERETIKLMSRQDWGS